MTEVEMSIRQRVPACEAFSDNSLKKASVRRPLIAPLVALLLPAILSGCHLSRAPSPALSMATIAVSVVGLLVAQSLISHWVRNTAG